MGKIALITGATGGLGSRVALKLSERGWRVVLGYGRNEFEAKRLLTLIGEGALAFQADIGDMGDVSRLADNIYPVCGIPDHIVNCAGVTKDAFTVKLRPEDWDEVLRVNLKGAFNLIRVFSPLMKLKGGGGHIINVSSYSGVKGRKAQAAYSASKAALLGLTYSAAAELGEFNIKVNAIIPGYMPTEMGKRAPEAMERAKKDSLLGTLSDPGQVAAFIANLLEMEGVTGQVFPVESRII